MIIAQMLAAMLSATPLNRESLIVNLVAQSVVTFATIEGRFPESWGQLFDARIEGADARLIPLLTEAQRELVDRHYVNFCRPSPETLIVVAGRDTTKPRHSVLVNLKPLKRSKVEVKRFDC